MTILQEIAKQHGGSISKQNFGTEGAELVFIFLARKADEISELQSISEQIKILNCSLGDCGKVFTTSFLEKLSINEISSRMKE